MAEAIRKDIDKILVEGTEIDEAVKKAVKEAVLRHKQAGNPIVVMKDGQMVWLKPEEIQV
jgi:isoaspartyl peptidase/L-asparaginase-like protein (Ntn-hydrolase superfamily)